MRKAVRAASAGSAAILLLLAACKKKEAKAQPSDSARVSQVGSGSARVTYQPNVKVMEQNDGEKAIIGQSSDGAALLFDSSNAQARELQAGDVLLVKGILARTVLGAEAGPEGTLVLTQQATMPDIIQDGAIDAVAPVRFGSLRAQAPSFARPAWANAWHWFAMDTVHAASGEFERPEDKGMRDAYGNMVKGAISGVCEGWDTKFKATPSEGKVDLDLVMSKTVGDVRRQDYRAGLSQEL